EGVLAHEGSPEESVTNRGLELVSDDAAMSDGVDQAVADNPAVGEKVRGGKTKAAGALSGAGMKQMRGHADAERVRELILEKLACPIGLNNWPEQLAWPARTAPMVRRVITRSYAVHMAQDGETYESPDIKPRSRDVTDGIERAA